MLHTTRTQQQLNHGSIASFPMSWVMNKYFYAFSFCTSHLAILFVRTGHPPPLRFNTLVRSIMKSTRSPLFVQTRRWIGFILSLLFTRQNLPRFCSNVLICTSTHRKVLRINRRLSVHLRLIHLLDPTVSPVRARFDHDFLVHNGCKS